MNPTDTRAQLETLFRRLSDPTVSDIEAMEACLWFRKMRHSTKDVGEALGSAAAPAPNETAQNDALADTGVLAKLVGFGKYGPKREGGAWTWGRVLREDRGYLDYLLGLKDAKSWMTSLVRDVIVAGKETTT